MRAWARLTERRTTTTMRRMERVRVESYAGYRAEQEPVAVQWDGARRRVEAIVRRWREPDAAFFRVRLEGGALLLLRQDRRTDEWTIASVAPDRGSGAGRTGPEEDA